MTVLSDVFRSLLGAPAATGDGLDRALVHRGREASADPRERTLLYGAGWAGVVVARSAQRDPSAGIEAVGFLDDDRRLKGSRAAGLPVLGDVNEMAAARRRSQASSVLITLPYASGVEIRRVLDAAIRHGLSVRTVPAATELLDGTIDARQARPLGFEDLVRSPSSAPSAALRALVEDRTVMVTGAGGRIGSRLVRRLLGLKPRRIAMVDEIEHNVIRVADELRHAYRVARGSTLITTHLVDVTDRDTISALVRDIGPSIILHAATLPETRARERSAVETIRVNVGGTGALVAAAIDGHVERLVLVSPDEPLEPRSVTGMSMRMAELIVRDAAHRGGACFTSVRVGRLGGASEADLEALRSQLESGRPVRVDASQQRCLPVAGAEACGLILEAAALAEPGSLYRVAGGVCLRAADVTRDLIRLLGRDAHSVPLKVVGRPPHDGPGRPHADDAPTSIPGLLRIAGTRATPPTFAADVDRFMALAVRGEGDRLRVEMARYVRYMASTDAPYLDESGQRPVVPIPVSDTASTASPGRRPSDVRRARRRPVARPHDVAIARPARR